MSELLTPQFLMPEVEELTKELVSLRGGTYVEWRDAVATGVELAMKGGVDPDAFLMVSRGVGSGRGLIVVMEAFHEHYKENPYGENGFNMLLRYVEGSGYELEGWLMGLEYFYDWLGQNGRSGTFGGILRYVNDSLRGEGEGGDLRMIVERTLDRYGYPE